MTISKEIMEILVCPECKGKIRLSDLDDAIVCDKCRLSYPVRDGIPVMLSAEAKKV
ncbi:MAG: Trm112 family protein [Deltaproteobacteria bacterium]|nr:Trm112 family protein [Deltaproteobacteria bacterium]